MTTPQLRGQGVSIATYTKQLAQVFPRTEKVIQMRILIALAALLLQEEKITEDFDPIRKTILGIFADAEASGGREEWVRMIAGLLENILFGEASTEKAQEMLQTACDEIITSVQQLIEETEVEPYKDGGDDQQNEDNDDLFGQADVQASRLRTADVDPTLAPFRYSLLKPSLLEYVTPEVTKHAHFKINTASNLLQLDARLDAKKAQEETEHNTIRMATPQSAATGNSAAATRTIEPPGPIMPGLAPSKKRAGITAGNKSTGKAAAAATKKSSMFLAARKPVATTGKSGLHVRKAGASLRLVGKGRTIKPSVTGDAGTTGKTSLLTGTVGKSAKLRDAKGSKMMMLDVAEVADLAKEKEASKAAAMNAPKKGFKRKAAMSDAVHANKVAKIEPLPADTNEHNAEKPAPAAAPTQAVNPADLAAAALSSYQKQKEAVVAEPKNSSGHVQMGWRELLAEKNNLLSDVDRDRIQKFFEYKVNPTPEVESYDIKLHSERGTDPRTGESIKRTHYLKLNYNDWTSTQSKKTKRYKAE
jgi:hypothetical protein